MEGGKWSFIKEPEQWRPTRNEVKRYERSRRRDPAPAIWAAGSEIQRVFLQTPHVVKNDPTEIVFFEKYKDKEGFKAHGSSAYFQEAAQKFEDLPEGKIQVKFLEEV